MTASRAFPGEAPARSGGAQARPAGRPALSDRLPYPWLFPLLAFALTWVLIIATWHASDAIYGHSEPWTWHFIFKDAQYYLTIAEHGYKATSPFPWGRGSEADRRTAFFPLFPLLIRLASYLTGGSYLIAGLLVSVLAGAASAIGVWGLASRLYGHRVADRAVLLYCFFPGAMTFGLLYSEPLAVALSAAVLWAILERRWLLAGVIGAAATAERETLIVLAAVSGVAALHAIWTRREWRALAAPALTPLGVLAFFGYLGHRYHDYGFWFKAERDGWNARMDWGAHTIAIVLWQDPATSQYKIYNVLLIAMAIVAVAGIAMMLRARLPVPLTLFTLLVVLAAVLPSAPSIKPRLIWTAFPIFIGAAAKLPRYLFWPALIVSAAVLAFLIGWWPNHYFGPAP
jgi:Dolichyl-phosphate-mannose-protein mannosyltransferase